MRQALWNGEPVAVHLNEMEELLAGPMPGAVFVARRADGRAVGLLEVSVRYYADGCASRHVGYIEGWYVEKEYRQQGVGAALVQAAEVWARSQGCREMASDCELDNAVSQRAHKGLGYEEVGRAIQFRKVL
ncbi:MAG: GNAT family N-acetyltransferase [Candidatus Latescibacteria bacterium]|nr:GNAT family N-acetyltransferase [Candidatus Latescibacterota bacterium]